ncbi:hypothetical protein LLG39_12640 [bacterium]|nr:hypothetical protein [bacterium]
MALRFMDSFDHYQTSDITKKWTSVGNGWTISPSGRNGSCLQCTSGSSVVTKSFDNQSVWIVGFAVRFLDRFYELGDRSILEFWDGGSCQCSLCTDPGGHIVVHKAGYNGTVLATSSNSLSANTWYYVEIKVTIHGASGIVQVRVNGVDWIAETTNLDTNSSSNNYANLLKFVCPWLTIYYDDLYICDGAGTINNDFLGDVRIAVIYPDANGSNSDFVGSDGNSTDNYALVKEKATDFPDDETTYVQSDTIGATDTYLFEDVSFVEGDTAIDGVQLLMCAKKTAAGDKTLCPIVRMEDGNEYEGSNWNPSDASYSYMRQVYERTPEPSPSQWTPDIINATEFGHRVKV